MAQSFQGDKVSMEKVVHWISSGFVENGIILEEEQEVYDFGIECIILKGIHYASYFLIALFMKAPFALFIMGCAFLPLRRSAGGYHAKTRIACLLVSCFTVFAAILFFKLNVGTEVYFLGFLISVILIIVYAPLDNENKRMNQLEMQYFRKKARIILMIVGMVILGARVCGYLDICKMLISGVMVSAIAIIGGKVFCN